MTNRGAGSGTRDGNSRDRRADGAASGGGRRVTVNLSARAARARDEIHEATEDNTTDIINRALLVYAELDRRLREGGRLFVQRADGDEYSEILIVS